MVMALTIEPQRHFKVAERGAPGAHTQAGGWGGVGGGSHLTPSSLQKNTNPLWLGIFPQSLQSGSSLHSSQGKQGPCGGDLKNKKTSDFFFLLLLEFFFGPKHCLLKHG